MTLTWTGNGRGTVVLLHGMMSLAGTWWRIGPALAARGWDVTALDLAAHGGNRMDGPLTTDALVDSVVTQVADPVDLLVGHSLGAVTAISAVGAHPELARAVVLEDPPGGRPAEGAVGELARGVELDAETARTDRDVLVRRSRRDHPGWADDDVEHDVVGVEQADAVAVASGLRAGLAGWDVPRLVAAAGMPVLLLAAAEPDSALIGEVRSATRAALPAGRFLELAGGHCLHRDLPDHWLAAVDAFTAEVLPAPGGSAG